MCASRAPRKNSIFPGKRPLFYYITDRRRLGGISLMACVRNAIRRGADFVQVREKDLGDRALLDLTRRVVAAARDADCRVLVNGRADIAVASGAHGVHLPSTGFRVRDIRKWLPPGMLIGISVHTLSEVRRACDEGVDYMLLGHVFPTESKLGYAPALGLDHLRKACAISIVPVFGLGGITPELIQSVLDAGAAGVAGIGLFQNTGFRIQDAG